MDDAEELDRLAGIRRRLSQAGDFHQIHLIRGATSDDVHRAFGVDLTRPLGFEQAEDEYLNGSTHAVGTFTELRPDLVMVLMMDDGQADLDQMLARATPSGRGAQVTDYGDGPVYLCLADRGEVVSTFATDEAVAADGPVPTGLEGLFALAGNIDAERLYDVTLAMAERFVGAEVTGLDASAFSLWYPLSIE